MLAIRRNYPSISLMDSLFENLFDFPVIDSTVKTPIHDVIENDNEFQIEALLAGVKKEDINVEVEDNVLTIQAERKEVKDVQYNRKETYFGKYKRLFNLPDNVDIENIESSLNDGVLKIVIPKNKNDTKTSKLSIEIK